MVKNSKTLKLVVCMSLIAALAISALGLSVLATPESTYTSGDQSADIVDIAAAQVGYAEGGDGYTKYGDWYGLPYSDWCAMFVSWCADQAGVTTDVFPRFALCSAGADWFISQGRFHYAGTYAPQAGDLIFYASYGDIYHVGLVTGSDDSHVYSIEGNYCEAVYNVSYPLSYGDIMGYATPAYNTSIVPSVAADDADETDSEVVDDVTTNDEVVSEVTDPETDEDEPEDDDAESSVDSEAESEVETETDTEAESEVETETDTEAESEVETETDTEAESEVETETDTEAESEIEDDTDNETVDVIMGDVDGDGYVTSADALMIRRYLLGKLSGEKMNYLAADVDGSGDITINDALIVLEMSVGL